jgi:hypothetical protein
MNGGRRADSGKGVDLSGIGQFVVDVDRGGILKEFAKAGAGIGKTPTGGLDPELIEGPLNSLILMFVHKRGGFLEGQESSPWNFGKRYWISS